MTGKQEKFARLLIEGCGLSDAYRIAYSAEAMSDHAIAVEAGRLAKNPDISLIVEEGRKKAMADSTWNRSVAVDRLERVNATAFSAIVDDGSMDRATVQAFFDSLDRLGDMCATDVEVRELREEMAAEPDRLRRKRERTRRSFDIEMEL